MPPLEGRQALRISTEISQSSVRLFSRSIESGIQWFVNKPLGHLLKGLNALYDRGGRFRGWTYHSIRLTHLATAINSSLWSRITNRGNCVQGDPEPPFNGSKPLSLNAYHSGERRVSSAFDGRLEHAKQYLKVAGSGRRDCRHSRASCRKLLLFSPLQVDNRIKDPGTPTKPGTTARTVFW